MAIAFGAVSTIAGAAALDQVAANYPSGISANDLLVIVAGADAGVGSTVDSWVTPSGFTSLATVDVGTRRSAAAFYKVAVGSETGTILVAVTSTATTASLASQIARYSGNATTSPVELANTGTGTGTTPAPPSIGATSVANELAVCLITSTNSATTCTVITGMSGGTWTESAPEQTTTGPNMTIDFQHAALASGGSTISGGTATLGVSGIWKTIGFAIKPLVATSQPYDLAHSPSHQAQMAS